MSHLAAPKPALDLFAEMRSDYEGYRDVYQAGKFWDDINQKFVEELQTCDLSQVRGSFMNRRFAGPDPSNRQVYRALLNLYFKSIRESDHDRFLESHHEPEYGGDYDQELFPFPHGSRLYEFESRRPMSLDFLQSVEESLTIQNWSRKLFDSEPDVIVELGSGYGRLAYVARKMFPNCTYVCVDLPESLVICHDYLRNTLPGEVADYELSRSTQHFDRDVLSQHKVWHLGTQQVESLADNVADVFVNIYSFAEMPIPIIKNYLDQAGRFTQNMVFMKQRKLEQNFHDAQRVTQKDYDTFVDWEKIDERDTTLYPDFFQKIYRLTASE